jgi:hypothetical protein
MFEGEPKNRTSTAARPEWRNETASFSILSLLIFAKNKVLFLIYCRQARMTQRNGLVLLPLSSYFCEKTRRFF